MKFLTALALTLMTACASSHSPNYLPYDDEGSNANAAAYAAHNMTFRKDMPKHADPHPWEFYYKHCALNGNDGFESKTAYDCSGPAF